ncbi:hypothetical protein NitYY0826_C0987 [Nitratiruptor sp. YY08-26]|nr:hypothetical protein NitYY0813_C0985 [Nitratiruptor sp. YY08-13]BCD66053.1 hypothetical protein NitYY0826_C0987 [Nitratiruptor sp. YY08-26]
MAAPLNAGPWQRLQSFLYAFMPLLEYPNAQTDKRNIPVIIYRISYPFPSPKTLDSVLI